MTALSLPNLFFCFSDHLWTSYLLSSDALPPHSGYTTRGIFPLASFPPTCYTNKKINIPPVHVADFSPAAHLERRTDETSMKPLPKTLSLDFGYKGLNPRSGKWDFGMGISHTSPWRRRSGNAAILKPRQWSAMSMAQCSKTPSKLARPSFTGLPLSSSKSYE